MVKLRQVEDSWPVISASVRELEVPPNTSVRPLGGLGVEPPAGSRGRAPG